MEATASAEYSTGPLKAGGEVSTSAEVETSVKDKITASTAASREASVGHEDSGTSENKWDTSNTSTSSWNTESGYESSSSTSRNTTVSDTLSQVINNRYSYSSMDERGGSNSTTNSNSESQTMSDEYSSTIEYSTEDTQEYETSISYTSNATGYYRLVSAGTLHVFAVVGYDIATNSYFTYTYNILDKERHTYLDYSKDNANFNDCENAVLPFEIPYAVHQYVFSKIARSNGLVIDQETGIIEAYTGSAKYVTIPEYISVNNGDGTCSAVRVRGISANAFRGNTAIKGVLFPKYVSAIPAEAFAGCTSLEVVSGYGIQEIGAGAFRGCTSLGKFFMDKYITSLGENAFENVPEISINAANTAIAMAAAHSGAKRITLNLSDSSDGFDDQTVEISNTTEQFFLIGNGSVYQNLKIKSDAAETKISNMIFAGNASTPLQLSSPKVTLSRVTVRNSPGYSLILNAENTELSLFGTIELSSQGSNAVISRNVTLQQADAGVVGKLRLTGNYLVCRELTNPSLLSFVSGELKVINDEKFEQMVTSCVITFDANGGELEETQKVVPYGQPYGTLPVPTRVGHSFAGWFTADGTRVTEGTKMDVVWDIVTLTARWTPLSYTVSWNTGTGYSITVKRTSSPYAGASTGTLSSGSTVYYGDTLSVSYAASTGYSLGSHGSSSFTVTGNITSSSIYASASLNSYTYNIVYQSSNGTRLGSSTATYKYGTTNTISPKSFSGYNTPASQSVRWNSTSAKTITFTYSISSVTNHAISGNFSSSSPHISYSTTMAYRNRTANSVEVQVTTTVTMQSGWSGYNYGIALKTTYGSVSSGKVQIANYQGLSSSGSSRTASTGWMTIPLSTTNPISISFNANLYNTNWENQYVNSSEYLDQYYSWAINIPAY